MPTTTDGWTLEELHRLPDDGNKYELVRGELFVTPTPSVEHEDLRAVLSRILCRIVETWHLGRVYASRSVIRTLGSEVEPDILVRAIPQKGADWADLPIPILVVEVISGSTRRRDHGPKRELYLDAGVSTYWIVDGKQRTFRVVVPGQADVVVSDSVVWQPAGAGEPLTIDLAAFFREALG